MAPRLTEQAPVSLEGDPDVCTASLSGGAGSSTVYLARISA